MSALIAQSHSHYWWILDVALVICFAPEWIGTFFQNPEQGAVRRDRGSYALLMVSMAIGLFVAFSIASGLPAATIAWQQPLVFWTGIVLMLAGAAFRWYAIKVLGRFFTRSVSTREGQYVVETGPYRLIRHPSYTGSMVTMLGLGLAMTNWLSLIVIVLFVLIGYEYRVRVEERALCDGIGDAYRDYMLRTKRFVPHVW